LNRSRPWRPRAQPVGRMRPGQSAGRPEQTLRRRRIDFQPQYPRRFRCRSCSAGLNQRSLHESAR
jgi:hypothetical protein